MFDRGINPISGLLGCLLDADRIEAKGAGNFIVKPAWTPDPTDKEPIKFKASMDRNDVPMDILLRCPALIDAASTEEVEKYLEPFKASIEFRPEDDTNIELNDVLGEDDEEEIDEELES